MATIAKQASRSAKQAPASGVSGMVNTVSSWPERFRAYVDGLRREMRLVTWPTRQQVQATTVVVLVTVFAFAVFFAIVDYLLAFGQSRLYEYFR